MDRLQEFLELFNKAAQAYGVKAPTGTPTTNYPHGPGGLFGIAGLDEQVISARITPRGLATQLSVSGSVFTNPEFAYITGYEETGDEPSGTCDTCISGVTEACIQTAQFGRVCRETKEFEVDRVMERVNRGEYDLTLLNSILGEDTVFTPTGAINQQNALNIATAWGMVEVGIGLQNVFSQMLWQGNPANNTAGGGYKEFPGLDILISENKYDAHSGVRCQALDSDVKEFNYQEIGSVDADSSFRIVRLMTAMANYLYHNASRQNLLPVSWVLSMRPEAWTELLEMWPAAYYSTRELVLPNGNTMHIDATRVAELRDMMASGMYIDIAGRRYPVVTDDGIFEHTNVNNGNVPAGFYASSIYFVPVKFLGNQRATYIEYKDYRGAQADLQMLGKHEDFWYTDNGRFFWVVEQQKWCYTMSGKMEPRVVLKTPQLAGRIDHVLYSPEQHNRSPYQDSDYFFKGGYEETTAPSLWSDWNPNN